MPNKPIIIDDKKLKLTVLEHLKERGDMRNIIEARLNNTLKANLSTHLREPAESRLAALITELEPVDISTVKDLTLREFAEEIIGGRLGDDEGLQKGCEEFLAMLPEEIRITEFLNLDQPLDKNLLFTDIVQDSRFYHLIQLTPLRDREDAMEKFLAVFNESGGLHSGFWEALEEDGIASREELEDIKLTFELTALTLENPELVEALKTRNVKSIKDLIPFRKDDWLKMFKEHNIAPPDSIEGENPEDAYANYLLDRIADESPTAVFFNQLLSNSLNEYIEDLIRIDEFLKANPDFDLKKELSDRELRWPTDDPQERENIKQSITHLRKFLKFYSHLGLERILSSADIDPDTKVNNLHDEVAKLGKFYLNNPNLDLFYADFHNGYATTRIENGEETPKIDWKGFPKREREKLTRQLKVYQRVFRIRPRFKAVKVLLEHDLDSARKISFIPKEQFVAKYADLLSNPNATIVEDAYDKALGITENTALQWANIKDAVASPYYDVTFFNNVGDDLKQYRSLQSYQDMFGSLNFCECEHCKSIFSPAAYFVDVMRFIDLYVTSQNSTIPKEWELESRRPDLWEIPLDCKNTNTLISYLDIVNEILERKLDAIFANSSAKDVYQNLLNAKHPFTLPFNLPLEQIRIYLSHFNKDLSEIYAVFGESDLDAAREYLNISLEELAILTTSTTDVSELAARYGTDAGALVFEIPIGLSNRVKKFLYHTGLSRKELNELLFQNLSQDEKNAEVQQLFFINNVNDGKRSLAIGMDTSDPENRFEIILNLSEEKLDRIHRFIRLSRKLGWSFADLDWVLRSLDKTEPGKNIDDDTIIDIARIKRWQDRYSLPLDILCSFWSGMKNVGKDNPKGSAPQDLFNRVFNHPDVLSGKAPYDPPPVETLDLSNVSDKSRNWLLAALEIYDEDLSRIVGELTNPTNPQNPKPLQLTRGNLARLYRFSKIPKVLGLRVREFIFVLQLMKAAKRIQKNEITGIKDFDELTKVVDWIKSSGFSVYELHYMVTQDINEFIDPGYSETEIRLFVEDLSKESKNVDEKIVLERLGVFFGTDPGLLQSIIEFAGQSLPDAAFLKLLSTPIKDDQNIPAQISNFLRAIHVRLFLVNTLALSKSEIEAITANPEYFGIKNPAALNIEDLKRLHVFKHLTRAFNDTTDALLQYFKPGTRKEKIARLAEFTQWDEGEIGLLFDKFWPVPDTGYNDVEGVLTLKKCVDLSSYMGVSIDTLVNTWLKTLDGDWTKYTDAAKSALEILKAKYSEDEWKKKYEPLHDKIRVLKRDVLSAYAIWNLDKDWPANIPRIKDLRDLYEYLLIDVEMSSCAKISRIKQAISSLQLYIQRCRMNLEPGVKPESIPEEQWAWMKNYRVWEANRKVFLYPENYIEPELRDNKSPIFQELEDELLQAEVTEEAVAKAYQNYLDKFSELANLKIAGTYYDSATQTLYLFGRTNTEPYIYYYRKYIDETTWTSWEKVELNIKSKYVSPMYAFNRLFIFWVEITTTKESKIEKGSSKEPVEKYKATIKYSFYNFNKNWTQPQTLYEIETQKTIYDPTHPYWNNVYPVLEKADIDQIRISYGGYFYYDKSPGANFGRIYVSSSRTLSNNLSNSVFYPALTYSEFDTLTISSNELLYVKLTNHFSDPHNYYREASYPVYKNKQYNKPLLEKPQELIYGETPVLEKIAQDNVMLKVINSSSYDPKWFIFDNGNEEFLIQFDFAWFAKRFRFQRISTYPVHELSRKLFAGGVDSLLSIESQQDTPELKFNRLKPSYSINIIPPYSKPQLDFEGAYGLYYQEIFFHIPFLIANRLNANQKFEEAQKWYHYIFNPTISEPEQGISEKDIVWRYLPFRKLTLKTLEEILSNPAALDAYHKDPFKPHAIARLRLNAYPKAIVMKYIDNQLDWGDYLFAQDSWETITEATMLYVLAYDLLGARPEKLDVCKSPSPKNYRDIETTYTDGTAIPEFLIDLENSPSAANAENGKANLNNDISAYFCVPENTDLIDYWDRVEDRLYKIRHCLSIKGVARQLALFQPPISPMALVRAVAAGRDISSVLSDMARPLPQYRFTFMLEKAKGLVSTVQQLGAALLSALEKKDAEELALLRSTHEKNILQLTTTIKEKQREEAIESQAALLESKNSAKTRHKHYNKLIEGGLSGYEEAHLKLMTVAWVFEHAEAITRLLASVFHLIPNVGSFFAMTFGGRELGPSAKEGAENLKALGAIARFASTMSSTLGSYERRRQEWELQRDLAQHDIDQIQEQIEAAELRKHITEKEIGIHKKNIEQTDEVYDFLKNKFSGKDLYQWMANQLSGLYFQTYKMAYDFARSAEKAYQYERNTDESFVNFGHWDSLKKGLLAGERLMLELNQLEKAYLENNIRTLEIEKTISLVQLEELKQTSYGNALFALKYTGKCSFEFSEELFDRDYPGHYCRKIKNISISIPAIIGPYENIKATLTQKNNAVLMTPAKNAIKLTPLNTTTKSYKISLDTTSTNVRKNWRSLEQIAISRGINDSGMFELNFRDERYLPFEGTGAVSEWILEVPKSTNSFDFDSLLDVVITLKYTALFDGGLKTHITGDSLQTQKRLATSGYRMMSLKHEFSTEWHQFLNPTAGKPVHELTFSLPKNAFPGNLSNIEIKDVYLKLDIEKAIADSLNNFKIKLTIPGQNKELSYTTTDISAIKGFNQTFAPEVWALTIDRQAIPDKLRKQENGKDVIEDINGKHHYCIDAEKLKNIGMILVYKGEISWFYHEN